MLAVSAGDKTNETQRKVLNEFLTQQLRKRARKSVWETPHLLLATLPKRSGDSAQKDEATQQSEEYVQTGVVPAVAVALILRLTAPALIADLVVVRCHAAAGVGPAGDERPVCRARVGRGV
eukprot:COSAG06_NODE_17848_length_918_cov_0.832723_1_plen_121_part_00